MVYTIGVSFTAGFLAKAGYEETLGRLFVLLRGPVRAPLDDISARQAADYAVFLQQVPWHKWDFPRDAADLDKSASTTLRDRERRVALGLGRHLGPCHAAGGRGSCGVGLAAPRWADPRTSRRDGRGQCRSGQRHVARRG
ncbi:hypothetical protein [Tabrizicola sp.]|uniref:hypothetical protein n=1 Tax=Tabrizicola sp. TaxID=2005166 RepID=UPI0026159C04|nr:hypothetical protein [Tabrizicola sp.]MDM7932514.1 hypothetical protein [Tabrizicola sp.]